MEKRDEIDDFETKHKYKSKGKQAQDPCSCTKSIRQLINSTPYMLAMSGLTIYSILAFDIDKGFFDEDSSLTFSIIHSISISLFMIQIVLTSIVDRKYTFKFYFWIDIFSTLMMLLELIWIEDLLDSVQNIQVAVTFTRVSKASRFSKIGARSTRIIKLIRLLKLVKMFNKQKVKTEGQSKNSQYQQSNQQRSQFQGNNNNIIQDQTIQSQQNTVNKISILKIERPNVDPAKQRQLQIKWQIQSEELKKKDLSKSKEEQKGGSRIGQILQYVIQKNIVIMVMGLLLIVPLLSASTWFNKTAQMQPSTQIYLNMIEKQANQTVVSEWLDIFIHVSLNSSRPLSFFSYKNYSSKQFVGLNTNSAISTLRRSEKIQVSTNLFSAIFSKKKEIQITSWISIARNFLVVFLLLFTSIVFMRDLQQYALKPLQKMNITVLKIEKNPFLVMSDDRQDEQEENASQQMDQQEQKLQTNILQNVFIKISSLLALGVGQTPFDYNNNQDQGKIHSRSDLLQNSSTCLVEGIFMCLHFSAISEIVELRKEKSLQIINDILQIYHQTVIENGGYIFDQDEQNSFVCWKLNNQNQAMVSKNLASNERKKAELVFLALFKFCSKVNQYIEDKQNQNQQQDSFRKLKFHIGIHQGLAFCGSVGSEVKLSFRSMGRDVLITKLLCKLGRQNDLENLISGNFMRLIPFAHPIIAKIQQYQYDLHDKIKNITLETYSICISSQIRWNIKTETIIQSNFHNRGTNQHDQQEGVKKAFRVRQQLIKNHTKLKNEELTHFVKSYLKKNLYVEEFLEMWRQTLGYYEQGQWNSAKVGYKNLKDSQFKDFQILIQKRYSQLQKIDQPPPLWRISKKISFIS